MPTYCGSPSGRRPRHAAGDHAEVGVLGLRGGGRVGRGRRLAGEHLDRAVVVRRHGVVQRPHHGEPLREPGLEREAARRSPCRARWCGSAGTARDISAGASGLGSHVSNWLGPPHIQKRMTEVGGAVESDRRGVATRTADVDSADADPTRRNVRREIGPGQVRGMSDSGGGEGMGGRRSAGGQVYHGELAGGNGCQRDPREECDKCREARMPPFTPSTLAL